ncbi:hypothetical protein [Streptomyces sp. NPDC018693]|uniref:hypothetical protein n=1 Tax=unclassified Streptomyces TaxID=2593676 RepID=UPI003789CF2F
MACSISRQSREFFDSAGRGVEGRCELLADAGGNVGDKQAVGSPPCRGAESNVISPASFACTSGPSPFRAYVIGASMTRLTGISEE